jgi:hypothetical protein
MQEGIIKVTV